MNESELDEWQGLTIEKVRNWLRAKGWTYYRRGPANEQGHPYAGWGKGKHWIHDDGDGLYLDHAISQIADERGESEQATLRELNPRMKTGWPGRAAIDAWLMKPWLMIDDEGVHRTGYFNLHSEDRVFVYETLDGEFWLTEQSAEQCEFWPCDDAMNKVRWPVDGNGVML